jgi:hypothetical protein
MQFLTNERNLWFSEVETLSKQLAHKSNDQILYILEDRHVIALKKVVEVKTTFFKRVLFLPSYPVLVIIAGLKYLFTGTRFLDGTIFSRYAKWLGIL